jgi:nucleotide-binding universal stress UspA family protein
MLAIDRILVPTDFSESSGAALDHARALCRRFGSKLMLMHVVETTGFTNVVSSSGYAAVIPDLFDEILAGTRGQLESLLTDKDRQAFPVETILRVTGRPAREIVRVASDAHVDLIVMGTQGRRGLSHLVLGSVAEEVVRTAQCPVLTVKVSEHGMSWIDSPDRATTAASCA